MVANEKVSRMLCLKYLRTWTDSLLPWMIDHLEDFVCLEK